MFFVGVDIEYFFPHNMCVVCIRINVVVRRLPTGGGWNLRQCIWYVQRWFMLIKSRDLCESSWFDRYASVHRYMKSMVSFLANLFTYIPNPSNLIDDGLSYHGVWLVIEID